METEPPSTCWVRARLMTDAMIGPTQGVQISPRLKPTRTPLQKPFRFCGPGAVPDLRAIREVRSSKRFRNHGTSITTPKMMISTTATIRRASTGMPRACTIAERARVKAVKLTTNPARTPKGRALPPPTPPERTIGRTGRMQGERIVMTPERKANPRRTIMALPLPALHAREDPVHPAAVPGNKPGAHGVDLHERVLDGHSVRLLQLLFLVVIHDDDRDVAEP